ncbi:MAG: hypothetical protein QOC82_2336 [Frankiaceae bacterium]|jgi:signal transduction histidine kinase|nr:hypothetical protein [Frankiaceae bacterium]
MTEHLRFAPEILVRLGEELVPHPDLGIIELVRNAYDADATCCTVTLENVGTPGGRVVVSDDGVGMDADDIRNGWLLLGRSAKVRRTHSPSGRRRVGEKGLGRLAALRLGHEARLVTTAVVRARARREHELRIDWREFDSATAVEDVPLLLISRVSRKATGTCVELTGLRQALAARDVNRLARALVLLTGPFPAENTFRAVLEAPEYEAMQKLVDEAYFGEHEYLLVAELANGRAEASLRDWRGRELAKAGHQRLRRTRKSRRQASDAGDDTYASPDARFELWMFNLSKISFDARRSDNTVRAVQDWLDVVGGVHLFHRDLRVHPYGDPGHDWLDMNLRRASSPELRPSTNNSVGRVVVTGEDNLLTPKTDRTGFVENDAFVALRRFALDALEWAADERMRLREATKERTRTRTDDAFERAALKMDEVVHRLPTGVRQEVERAVTDYQKAVGRQLQVVADDLQLYRTLGTVGTTAAVFAHETLRPVNIVEQVTTTLQRRAKHDLRAVFDERYADPFRRVLQAVASMRTFAELPLRMLRRAKRRPGAIDVNRAIVETLDIFGPYLADSGVAVTTEFDPGSPRVLTTAAAIEAVIANLLSNSVHFFGEGQARSARTVRIETLRRGNTLRLTFADSGPGIRTLTVDEVWLPGRTTRELGTGLGLTIVRDIVRDLRGNVEARAKGELGGAEFVIELPCVATDAGAL